MNPYTASQPDMTAEVPCEKQGRVAVWIIGLSVVLICVNVPLFIVAYQDKSWGALGIAIAIGPIRNGAVLLIGLICTPLVRKSTSSGVSGYVLATILLPVLAAGSLLVSIFMMDLRGC